MRSFVVVIIFVVTAFVAKAQTPTFTFQCVCDYLTAADTNCDICNTTTQSRFFKGILVYKNGVAHKWIEQPYTIIQNFDALTFRELIPGAEQIRIELLGTAFDSIQQFRDSVLCPCAGTSTSTTLIAGPGINIWNDTIAAIPQQIDTFDLVSGAQDTIRISLTRDSVPFHYVILPPDSDNQYIDTLRLTGTTLEISLFGDGQPLKTVSLASLVADGDETIVTAGTGISVTGVGTAGNPYIITNTGDISPTNELQTLANTSTATTHRVTVSNSGGSLELVEGAGIAIATTGTTLDGVATITNTGDLSNTNEIQALTAGDGAGDNKTIDLSLGGGTVTLDPAGGFTISRSGNTFTMTAPTATPASGPDSTWAKIGPVYTGKRLTDRIYRTGKVFLGAPPGFWEKNYSATYGYKVDSTRLSIKVNSTNNNAPGIYLTNNGDNFSAITWQLDSASAPAASPFSFYSAYFPAASTAGDNTTHGWGFNTGSNGGRLIPGKAQAVFQFEENYAANTSTGDVEAHLNFYPSSSGGYTPLYFTAGDIDGSNSIASISGNIIYFSTGPTALNKGIWSNDELIVQNPTTNGSKYITIKGNGTANSILRMRHTNNSLYDAVKTDMQTLASAANTRNIYISEGLPVIVGNRHLFLQDDGNGQIGISSVSGAYTNLNIGLNTTAVAEFIGNKAAQATIHHDQSHAGLLLNNVEAATAANRWALRVGRAGGGNDNLNIETDATTGASIPFQIKRSNLSVGIKVPVDAVAAPLHVHSQSATTGNILRLENNSQQIDIFVTVATPEGAVTGSIGDLASDATNGALYLKKTGTATNAGWLALDDSATNEAWTIDADDADTEVISNQTVKFEGAGSVTTDYNPATNVMLITGASGGVTGSGGTNRMTWWDSPTTITSSENARYIDGTGLQIGGNSFSHYVQIGYSGAGQAAIKMIGSDADMSRVVSTTNGLRLASLDGKIYFQTANSSGDIPTNTGLIAGISPSSVYGAFDVTGIGVASNSVNKTLSIESIVNDVNSDGFVFYNSHASANTVRRQFDIKWSGGSYLTILGSGNVGIGQVSPQRKLHVTGEARITDLTTDPIVDILGADADGDLSRAGLSAGLTIVAGVLTVSDQSQTNELQALTNTSNATTHTVTLSNGGGSVQLAEGSGITLTTTGTSLDGVVTIAATSSGATDLTFSGASSPVTLNSSTGTDVTITAGTGISLSATGTDIIITNTVTNTDAQNLTIEGSGPTYDIAISGGTDVTIQGAGIVTLSESPANTLIVSATEVDGSTSNELQTLASTSDATSHTVTLSNSGGSIQFIEGSNIALATSGTSLNGIVTISSTSTADGNGIYGDGTAGSGDDALPTGGSTVTIPGQWQPLQFNANTAGGQVWTALRVNAATCADDRFTKYLVGKSPADSLEIYNFDCGGIIKETGGTLTLETNQEMWLVADSFNVTTIPTRTVLPFLVGQTSGGWLQKMEGTTTGQVPVWDEQNGWWELGTVGGGTITGSGVAGQMTYWTGTTSVAGEDNHWWDAATDRLGIGTAGATPSSSVDITKNALGTSQTTTSGLAVVNTTAAAAGAQQISPAIRWSGAGWKTTATAASQAVEFRSYVTPVQGTTAPTGYLGFGAAINGSWTNDQINFSNTGEIGINHTTFTGAGLVAKLNINAGTATAPFVFNTYGTASSAGGLVVGQISNTLNTSSTLLSLNEESNQNTIRAGLQKYGTAHATRANELNLVVFGSGAVTISTNSTVRLTAAADGTVFSAAKLAAGFASTTGIHSTLQTGGSFAGARLETVGAPAFDATKHTVIYTASTNITWTLPTAASCACDGRVYILHHAGTAGTVTLSQTITKGNGGNFSTLTAGQWAYITYGTSTIRGYKITSL